MLRGALAIVAGTKDNNSRTTVWLAKTAGSKRASAEGRQLQACLVKITSKA